MMPIKMYTGMIDANGEPQVTVIEDGQEKPLLPRLDLRNHSPAGFSWGYYGSGPAQLALALLADAISEDFALKNYQHFKAVVIANIPKNQGWVLSQTVVYALVAQSCSQRGTS